MKQTASLQPITVDSIKNRIHEIRGQRVMLDRDLAELYHVETKVLNQAVKRNLQRFPLDAMFTLSHEEFECLRSQIVTSNKRGGTRYLPYAFTELGVLRDQNDINDDTATQLELINQTLAELQAEKTLHKEFTERKPIGFKTEK